MLRLKDRSTPRFGDKIINTRAHRHRRLATSPEKQESAPCQQYSLQPEAIHVVDSFAALDKMRQHILSGKDLPASDPQKNGNVPATESALDRGSQLGPAHTYQIVGLDAEWQPTEGFWPVSVLQVSTRSASFIIDMMWFCRPAPVGWSNLGFILTPSQQHSLSFEINLDWTSNHRGHCLDNKRLYMPLRVRRLKHSALPALMLAHLKGVASANIGFEVCVECLPSSYVVCCLMIS